MKRSFVLLLLFSLFAARAFAVPINLGTASTFGLLAGSGITNSGSSVINGDVGSSPTPSVTGFPPGIVIGTLYTTPNAVTAQAQTDLTTAYNAAAGAAPTATLTGIDLGFFNAGNPLGPGVYFFSSSAQLTGNLTLDGQGDPNAQWIFQIGSTLTTATNATVSFINGASPCNVFWQVGSSATIQTNNLFAGTIMALTSITLDGGTLNGRALARNGAVTIASAEFVNIECPAGPCVKVAKVADRDVASVGDVITYTYTVTNCGPSALTVNSVVDSRLGNITADFVTANGGTSTLAVGAFTVFTETHTVLATDPSPLTNVVTVDASSGGVNVTDTATSSVILTVPGPSVTMKKTANVTVASVGDLVTYTFEVCNTGTTPLTVNSVIDSRLGNLTADFITANGGTSTLAAGVCTSFIEVYKVLATDPSPLTNVATVSASSGGTTVTSSDQASVILIANHSIPSVAIVKSADRIAAAVGDVITYTYMVCNTGGAPLTVSSVIDTRLGNITAGFIAANGGSSTLAVGACVTFAETYKVKACDKSPLVNYVTVEASGGGLDVSDTDHASVIIAAPGPCVEIEKKANCKEVSVGDCVTYTFKVCNCGTLPLTVSSVVDSHLGNLTPNFIAANGGVSTLPVGACVTFTGTYKVKSCDKSPLVNCVKVIAIGGGKTVCDNAEECVTIKPVRKCFPPVTLTQCEWDFVCSRGLICNEFRSAFARYSFFGKCYAGMVIVGAPVNEIACGKHSITFTDTKLISNFLPQTGSADRLWDSFTNPCYLKSKTGAKTSNVLAGEVLALTMNIAFNDMRLMPGNKGYDLEKFTLTQGVFKGKTVGQVWNIADAVLSGASPCEYGLKNTTALVSILQSINGNYEYVDCNKSIDNGYLKPNGLLCDPGQPHSMVVPF